MKRLLLFLAFVVLTGLACGSPPIVTPTPTPATDAQIVPTTPAPPASLSATPPPALTPTATPQTSGSGKWMEIP